MDSQTQPLLENDYAVAPCPGNFSGKISSLDRILMSERNMDTIAFPIERNLPRCQSSGALLLGQVQRLGRNSTDRRYIMTLQSDGKEFPVLVADHQSSSWSVKGGSTTSRFIIRSFKDNSVLGSLTRSGTVLRDSTITYTLTHQSFQHCPIAYIRYEVPTVMQVLKECPPRRVFLEVPGRGTASKEPTVRGTSHQKSLDFRGRGKQASRKNMQLQNKGGRVVLQFVKWDKDIFNLDFA